MLEGPFPLVVGQFTPVLRPSSPESIIKGCSSATKPPAKKFHSHLIPSTPRNFQHVHSSVPSSVPPPSPKYSTSRPILALPMQPSTIPHPRLSPVLASHQLQPVASTSQRRGNWSHLPLPATQVFQNQDCWPIKFTREDPTVVNEGQDALGSFFRRVDRKSRDMIVYSNNRMIAGTASEEIAANFSLYDNELINKLQGTFDDLGKDNQFFGFICVWFPFISTLINTKKKKWNLPMHNMEGDAASLIKK
ncbi:hypothetical protein O181_082080 [Austropuccinia psidii MF-1]|uniref:Uncharacterized protein n=1 Tax=Austropuccinia psidii MF-1 TaxID=1389203 RepID=A0A9Q3IKI1_9BASI|nr:hypothetical protein [Austropuccinia psidii MF-1]